MSREILVKCDCCQQVIEGTDLLHVTIRRDGDEQEKAFHICATCGSLPLKATGLKAIIRKLLKYIDRKTRI